MAEVIELMSPHEQHGSRNPVTNVSFGIECIAKSSPKDVVDVDYKQDKRCVAPLVMFLLKE